MQIGITSFPSSSGAIQESSPILTTTKPPACFQTVAARKRDFKYNEFEFYAQDSWKVRSDLTVTYGLRYQIHSVPYEVNGFEAIPSVNENTYLSTRLAAAAQGFSGNSVVPIVSFSPGGAANNAPGYYKPDYKDFGPRLGIAYNPGFRGGLLGSLLGDRKTTIRAGASILHDRIAGGASFGLDQTTFVYDAQVNSPFGVPFDGFDSLLGDPRFSGINSNLPPFPTAPNTKPPFAPSVDASGVPFGTANGGFPAFFQFDHNTKNPYAILLNFGIQRELPGNLLLEATYVNRMGRRLLAVGDAGTTTNFKDTASGQFLRPAFARLQQELPGFIAQVNAGAPNPSVAPIPWFENQINAQIAANFGPGVSCANFGVANCATLIENFFGQFVQRGDLSSVILFLDESAGGLLAPNIGLPAQTSANGYIGNYAASDYNALLFTLRKEATHGLQFTFNYTYSHSIDNVSDVANNYVTYTGSGAGLVCELDNLRTCRADSDFDARHTINAHYIYDLPFGHGKHFLHDAPAWSDAILGGWSTSSIVTWRTGYPFTIRTGSFPTAFTLDAPAVLLNGAGLKPGIHTDSGGALQYFASQSTAISSVGFPFGGGTGTRNAARGPGFSSVDMGVWKSFKVPKAERQQFILRLDTFNTFNHPVFNGPSSATIFDTSQFGIVTSTASTPRVLQVALRYEF